MKFALMISLTLYLITSALYRSQKPSQDLKGVRAGVLSVDPDTVTWLNVAVNQTKPFIVKVNNTGNEKLTITKIEGPTTPFDIGAAPTPPQTLSPAQSIDFQVQFAPVTPGKFESDVIIESTAGNSPSKIHLFGTAK